MSGFFGTIENYFEKIYSNEDINRNDIGLLMYDSFRLDNRGQYNEKEALLGKFDINNKGFIKELNDVIENLLLRNNILTELLNHLHSKSIPIENVIDQILGIKTPEYAELTESQMTLMFATVKFKITPEKIKAFLFALSPSGDSTKIKVRDFLKSA
jgi:hypothetical protein